jgi:imidazolonepropionase-like amidohydrolase
MNRTVLINIVAYLLIGCSNPVKYNLVIKNVGLFDGENNLGKVNIAINADTIADISTKSLNSDSIIDGSGKYVIPGLVNAHVHITFLNQMKESYEHGILLI